jgi:hypothetical protein
LGACKRHLCGGDQSRIPRRHRCQANRLKSAPPAIPAESRENKAIWWGPASNIPGTSGPV